MLNFQTLGGKIVRHIYPKLDLHYFTSNYDYPEVIKGEFQKFDRTNQIFVVKNAKNQLKISSSDKYGTVILSFNDIMSIVTNEIETERPKLNQLISRLNDIIADANEQNRG